MLCSTRIAILAYASAHFQAFFTDKNPARVSDAGLAHFAVDVRFMTVLAANLPGNLEDVFAELSQVILGFCRVLYTAC